MFNLEMNFKRLWVYAVAIRLGDILVVKYGDTRKETHEDAHKYATTDGNTIGKLQGLIGHTNSIEVLFVEDVTKEAIEMNPDYDPSLKTPKKGFDNRWRPLLPGKRKKLTNTDGGSSLEIHIMDKQDIPFDVLRKIWMDALDKARGAKIQSNLKVYKSRKYLEVLDSKTDEDIDKFLLAAATGAGKETSTLASLILLHDKKKYLQNNSLHVACATIPSTVCELFEELSSVSGMEMSDGRFIDFSRIEAYVLNDFFKNYKKDLKDNALTWFDNNVKVVDKVSDIPQEHDKNMVPVLFGSYPDIASQIDGKIKKKYDGILERLGILSIGEAHQFLSKEKNKLWTNIRSYGAKFLFLVTGTPYDFIFNKHRVDLYFSTNERTVFSKNDLYNDKKKGGSSSDYAKYPDFNYYRLTIMKDFINELKKHPNWSDDANGMTYSKMHTYDNNTNKFKYEQQLITVYSRLLSIGTFSDGMSIHNAPGLCDKAKRHGIIALPQGSNGSSVSDYIPALVKLLEINNALGNYRGLVAYEDSLGDRKKEIEEDKQPTITFTCIKDLTGANIPSWGFIIFNRPIGDSIKQFEQSNGRVGRACDNKPNCGVFLADMETAINVIVGAEELLAAERDDDFSYRQIVESAYDNYFFFTDNNGQWEKIDLPNFEKIMENLSAKGNYGYEYCIKKTEAPISFDDIIFGSLKTSNNKEVILNENDNKGAKNTFRQVVEQLGFAFKDDSEKERNKAWHIVKQRVLAGGQKLALMGEISTVNDMIKWIENNPKLAPKIFSGVLDYVSNVINNNEIDIPQTNRWFDKVKYNSDIEALFSSLATGIHANKFSSFLAESNKYWEDRTDEVIADWKDVDNIIFPTAGRGTELYFFLKKARDANIKVDTNNIYYNDSDEVWVKIFRRINKQYKLNIPEKNITCVDFFKYDFNIKGSKACIMNSAYSAGNSGKGGKPIYHKFITHAAENCDMVFAGAPGTFIGRLEIYDEFRNFLDNYGIINIRRLPNDVLPANVIDPVFISLGQNDANKRVCDFERPEMKLFLNIQEKMPKWTSDKIRDGQYPTYGRNGRSKHSAEFSPNQTSEFNTPVVDRIGKRYHGKVNVFTRIAKKDKWTNNKLALFAQQVGATAGNNIYFSDFCYTSLNVVNIAVKDENEYNNLVKYLKTNIVRFMIYNIVRPDRTQAGTNIGFSGSRLRNQILPKIDLSKPVSDIDLAKLLGISDKEMSFINKFVNEKVDNI